MKKNVLITGAAGNLGMASVARFLSEGHRVIAVLSPGKTPEFIASVDLILAEADLTNEKSVERLTSRLIAEYHSIDVALLLVGGYAPGTIFETDGDRLKKMYSVNFETAYFMARPVFAQMMKQPSGGRILFIGSRPALEASEGKRSLAYALSKSLIFKLADFLNAEGASRNVFSSVIVPSTIDTPTNRESMPNADFSAWVTPEAIADKMALVAFEKAAPRHTVLKVYGKG